MSATGRSDVRHADDFYATPAWATRAILPHLHSSGDLYRDLLDPCAGAGALLQVAKTIAQQVRGIELDAGRAQVCGLRYATCANLDALGPESWGAPDIVLTNPPYKLAREFADRALREVRPGGTVAMLLRLNWLASQARADFHRANPSDVYILPRRPSFTGGGTDATEYAWFVWGIGRGGRWSILNTAGAA